MRPRRTFPFLVLHLLLLGQPSVSAVSGRVVNAIRKRQFFCSHCVRLSNRHCQVIAYDTGDCAARRHINLDPIQGCPCFHGQELRLSFAHDEALLSDLDPISAGESGLDPEASVLT